MQRKPDPMIKRSTMLIGSAVVSMLVQLIVIYIMGLHKDFEYIFILVICFNLFGIFILVNHLRKELNRTGELKKMTRHLGLNFKLTDEGDFFEGFKLYRGGEVRNVLEGRMADNEVKIFGYTYTTGSGDSSNTVSTTVMLLENSHLDLPHFFCRPETFWEKKLFHADEDLEFGEEPEFSKLYYLTGEDEARIRELFNHELIQFFVRRSGDEDLTVEGKGRQLALYQKGLRVKPDEARALMEEGREAVTAFRAACKHIQQK